MVAKKKKKTQGSRGAKRELCSFGHEKGVGTYCGGRIRSPERERQLSKGSGRFVGKFQDATSERREGHHQEISKSNK